MKKLLMSVAVAAVALGGGWFAVREGYITVPFISAQPSLDREIAFPEGFSQEVADSTREAVAIDQSNLKTDPSDIDAWLDLAIQYKRAGDFRGAQEVWEYMSETFPQQDTSAFNLGVLFHHDLKKYAKSEAHYLEAIRRNPQQSLNYLGLHELYRYAYKQDTNAAVDILRTGMEHMPDDANMPIALAAYYRDDKKDYPVAIEYIRKAVDILNHNKGDEKKVQALEAEIERLSHI